MSRKHIVTSEKDRRDLEKILKPIMLDFAKQLEHIFSEGSAYQKKTDRYVADLLKEAATMGAKK